VRAPGLHCSQPPQHPHSPCRFVQGFKMHLVHAEAVTYSGGLQLKRIRGSINQTCADTGGWAADVCTATS